MNTLVSGKFVSAKPSLLERVASQLASLYKTFMDSQALAFRRAKKSAPRMHWSQSE